ncbi:MAG: DUF5050 domain-containing protein [Clostridia bacterium]|nr:DUF5050 domain-containing protein [Clostridia bacterium]
MRKIFILSVMITAILAAKTTLANSYVECSANIHGQQVNISGCILNVNQSHQVSLLVGDVNNILYIDQKSSDSNGAFSFDFRLPDTLEAGTYAFGIGTTAGTEKYSGILIYEPEESSTVYVECTATVTGQQVNISGRILNVNQSHQVSLLVGDVNNILYIDQKSSDSNGEFSFDFRLPDSLEAGIYDFGIGTTAGTEKYSGTITYVPVIETVERQFFDADVTVSISNFVPTLTGTMSCIKDKTLNFSAVNATDNTIIAQDTVTADEGVYNISYTLPSLITGKDYTVVISCTEGNSVLFSVDVEINSSVILLSVSGGVQVSDNVKLDVRAKTSNSDLIDKSSTFTADKAVSVTIPNLVPNMSCDISIQGYETIPRQKANALFTKVENFKIEWLYTATVGKFYSAGGNLYSYINNSELKLSEDLEAKFIVSHGDYVYFSNMRENGRIYRCNKDGSNLTLVSEDSGSWLYIKNGNLYYKDNGNNREEKCVNISAE